jgi:hypothetical protein
MKDRGIFNILPSLAPEIYAKSRYLGMFQDSRKKNEFSVWPVTFATTSSSSFSVGEEVANKKFTVSVVHERRLEAAQDCVWMG